MAKKELIFNIPEATPHTLPMARLADYLKKLSTIFGNDDRVHFLRVDPGSALNVIEVDEEIEPAVIERTKSAAIGAGTKETVQAFQSLSESLEQDGFTAELENDTGDVIAHFAHALEVGETFGPFWQAGEVDGLLTRIEGIDESVHLTLWSDGVRYNCVTTQEKGKGLRYLDAIRAVGRGQWYRNEKGKWELKKFIVSDIEPLEDDTLLEVVARLRAIPGNPLESLKDPIGEMLKLRHGGGE